MDAVEDGAAPGRQRQPEIAAHVLRITDACTLRHRERPVRRASQNENHFQLIFCSAGIGVRMGVIICSFGKREFFVRISLMGLRSAEKIYLT